MHARLVAKQKARVQRLMTWAEKTSPFITSATGAFKLTP